MTYIPVSTDSFEGDVVVVHHKDRLYCNGQGCSLGHPGVYLTIKLNENSVTCPYCSRQFCYIKEEDEN